MGSFFPAQIVPNTVGLRNANAVFCTDLVKGQRVGLLSDLSHILPVKLGLIILFAAAWGKSVAASPLPNSFCNTASATVEAPASANHISRIVVLSAKNQMIRINTAWRVASVPDNKSFRYWPVKQQVNDLRPVPSSTVASQFKRSVALWIAGLLPNPAPSIRHNVVLVKARYIGFNFHKKTTSFIGHSASIASGGRKV